MQYYNVLDEKQLSIDSVDCTLDCIRLQCHRSAGVPGKSKSGKMCGLLPINFIRERVHNFRSEKVIHVLSLVDRRRNELPKLAEDK